MLTAWSGPIHWDRSGRQLPVDLKYGKHWETKFECLLVNFTQTHTTLSNPVSAVQDSVTLNFAERTKENQYIFTSVEVLSTQVF